MRLREAGAPRAPWLAIALLLSGSAADADEPAAAKERTGRRASAAPGEPERAESARVPHVIVLRPPGLRAYEEIVEELRGRIPASVRTLATKPLAPVALRSWLESYRPRLVLAIGQAAHDLARAAWTGPVVSALAFHRLEPAAGARHHVVPCQVAPEEVLRALRLARPRLRSVALLHGAGTTGPVTAAIASGRAQGVEVLPTRARSPAEAISRLRAAVSRVDALWLQPDLDVLTLQVFQYALVLQFRRGVALVGASRRHAAQGALLALDHSPTAIGRQAAQLANQILASSQPAPSPPLPVELSVNLTTAARIGADVAALRRHAARVYH
jgi:hypothetical protein